MSLEQFTLLKDKLILHDPKTPLEVKCQKQLDVHRRLTDKLVYLTKPLVVTKDNTFIHKCTFIGASPDIDVLMVIEEDVQDTVLSECVFKDCINGIVVKP